MDINENTLSKAATETVNNTTVTKATQKADKRFQQYGWGNFRPRCLQFLNTPRWSLVVITVYSFCQGVAVLGLTSLVLPTLERRFSFSSKELGIISASNDVSALLIVVFISFYGDYANKVKWMGCGAAVTGLGVLLFALPQAMVGKYEPVGKRVSTLCQVTNATNILQGSQQCEITNGGQWYYLLVFVISQLIIGVGNSPFYSLLSPYLDEIADPKNISAYLGIFNVFNFTAPGIGYLIGGKLLSIYVDIVQPAGQKLTPRNPAWIGAWWIGFLVFGFAILVSSIFILGFPDPNEMPGAKERREEHVRKGHLKRTQSTKKPGFKEFLPELKCLFRNGTFVFSTLATTVAFLFTVPLFVFFSKILREKFGMDPVSTGYAMSLLSIVSVLVGNFCGSFAARLFSLRETCKKAALVCAVVYLLTAISPLIFLIPGCENTNLAGITLPYNREIYKPTTSALHFPSQSTQTHHSTHGTQRSQSSNPSTVPTSSATSQCNTNCRCSMRKFTPICGSNSITYISPCHAGCKGILRNKTFTNCSCIQNSVNNSTAGTARPGYCDRNCKNAKLFLGICGIILIIRFTAAVPQKLVTLRCVPDDKRAFAAGIQYFTLKIFGLLPSPIIFGHLVDVSCRLWQELCGKKGRCFDYDIDALSRNVCIYGICIISFATVLYFMAWYFCTSEIKTAHRVSASDNYGADERKEEISTKL